MKIAILGGGVSGLVALQFANAAGHDAICFEQTAAIGGCWSGDGTIGMDAYGNRKRDGMYKDLTTNLPKEVMCFEGHDHADHSPKRSFVTQKEIYDYIKSYADKHNLHASIQLGRRVVRIAALSDEPQTRWRITVRDLRQSTPVEEDLDFDVVILAMGHFVHPFVPDVEGLDLFEGLVMHSNEFRDPEQFRRMDVLVVGGGPSGSDIANRMASCTKVYQSIKPTTQRFVPIGKDVIEKCQVARFDGLGAHFTDGTFTRLDAVIFCTGYKYTLPCEMSGCGLTVENNWYKHLYKHCINIERPSMAIIGLPYGASVFALVNLQARYYMAFLAGRFTLPSKEAMMASVAVDIANRREKGIPDDRSHVFSDCCRALSAAMAEEARIHPTPEVIFNIMDALIARWNEGDVFEIVDNQRFIRTTSKVD